MSTYNVDYAVVKKPGQDTPLTKKQAKRWRELKNDPLKFMTEECWVVGPHGKTLFEPRDYQIDLLNDILANRLIMANAPRQSGKSALLVLLALHTGIFHSDATVGMTSYRLSGCKDLLSRVKYSLENLADFLKPPVTLYNQSEIRFTNGSTIFTQVTSSQIFRGRSFGKNSLAIFDEFAHVDLETAEAAYEAAMPALEGGGASATSKAVIISTPNGTGSNKYAQLAFGAMEDANGWIYHKVDPDKIPGRDEAWKAKTIKTYGMARYLQEFRGEFISSKPLLVSSMVLEALKVKKPTKEIDGSLKLFTDSFNGKTIGVAVDVSEGVGLDSSTIQIYDLITLEQLGEYENNTANQNDFTRDLLKILTMIKRDGADNIYMGVEKNSVGAGVLRLLETSSNPILDEVTMINDVDQYGAPKGHSGLSTNVKSKGEACALLKELIESYKLKINSISLINQLRLFMKHANGGFKAERGGHDDLVSAMLILMMMLKQLAHYEDSVDGAINDVDDMDIDAEVWGFY
jgi:hypothetical protein